MGVAHFGSWVRNAQLYLKRYCKAKTFKIDKPGKIGRLRWKDRH